MGDTSEVLRETINFLVQVYKRTDEEQVTHPFNSDLQKWLSMSYSIQDILEVIGRYFYEHEKFWASFLKKTTSRNLNLEKIEKIFETATRMFEHWNSTIPGSTGVQEQQAKEKKITEKLENSDRSKENATVKAESEKETNLKKQLVLYPTAFDHFPLHYFLQELESFLHPNDTTSEKKLLLKKRTDPAKELQLIQDEKVNQLSRLLLSLSYFTFEILKALVVTALIPFGYNFWFWRNLDQIFSTDPYKTYILLNASSVRVLARVSPKDRKNSFLVILIGGKEKVSKTACELVLEKLKKESKDTLPNRITRATETAAWINNLQRKESTIFWDILVSAPQNDSEREPLYRKEVTWSFSDSCLNPKDIKLQKKCSVASNSRRDFIRPTLYLKKGEFWENIVDAFKKWNTPSGTGVVTKTDFQKIHSVLNSSGFPVNYESYKILMLHSIDSMVKKNSLPSKPTKEELATLASKKNENKKDKDTKDKVLKSDLKARVLFWNAVTKATNENKVSFHFDPSNKAAKHSRNEKTNATLDPLFVFVTEKKEKSTVEKFKAALGSTSTKETVDLFLQFLNQRFREVKPEDDKFFLDQTVSFRSTLDVLHQLLFPFFSLSIFAKVFLRPLNLKLDKPVQLQYPSLKTPLHRGVLVVWGLEEDVRLYGSALQLFAGFQDAARSTSNKISPVTNLFKKNIDKKDCFAVSDYVDLEHLRSELSFFVVKE